MDRIRTTSGAEVKAFKELSEQGYTVVKAGWPDFLAVRGDEVRFIEVKGPGDHLRASQLYVADVLRRVGITVEVMKVRKRDITTRPVPQPRKTKRHRGGDLGFGIDPKSKIPWGRQTLSRARRNCHLCKRPVTPGTSISWWGRGGWCCESCDRRERVKRAG